MIKLKNILLESETGLFVYPSTQTDFIRLNRWLNKSSHYAEVDKRNQRLFFPENPSGYDSLEEKLRALED